MNIIVFVNINPIWILKRETMEIRSNIYIQIAKTRLPWSPFDDSQMDPFQKKVIHTNLNKLRMI